MTCTNIVLMIADLIGLLVLIRKLKRDRWKKRYRLGSKRIYFINLLKN